MRPVERGPHPIDPETSASRVFADYRDARADLIHRIGDYCSYCEVALPGPAVEHIQPKSMHPGLEGEWSHFLLVCVSCNSIKGASVVAPGDCYWPDIDNTARVFLYDTDLPPRLNAAPHIDQERGRRTLTLTGLDRVPGHDQFSSRDVRWSKRKEVWGIALNSLRNLLNRDSHELRESIMFTAISRGFFSVWMTVFQADADMRRRFICAFQGTARDCFNDQGEPLPRPGGAV